MLAPLFVPAIMVALASPLILKKAARSLIHRFRNTNTMSSALVWYRANRIAWIAVLVAGMFWLVVALLLPMSLPFWLAYRE
jgi:hypothetical protein